MIEVEALELRYGSVAAVNGVSFAADKGELVTLLGPSGCGKTSTLRAIAGLEEPSGGRISLGGTVVYSAAERRNVASERRGVSMVFQSYAIWPHMNVFDNVAYGLRVRRLPRAEVEQQVMRALALVQMQDYATRSAVRLSGGQQQRVAVARAIAFSPEVVLFDEPLSNLDAKLRAEMRVELRELQRRLSFTSIYVTHDQEEALAISDRVIVMNEGRIEQVGAPRELYNRPQNRFVADFLGAANIIPGRVRGGATANGEAMFETAGGHMIRVRAGGPLRGDEDAAAVRASYIHLAAKAPPDAANVAVGLIERRHFHGDFIEYRVRWPAGQLIVRTPPTGVLEEGQEIALWFEAEHCALLEPARRSAPTSSPRRR
ncbi:MAG TPA: ABC transporter ATP-binding protein [Stellaceae bacterium]|nr:ABC transporter ATP-binding protein [Stellaceae bacterium]